MNTRFIILFIFIVLLSIAYKDVYSDFIMPISADLDTYKVQVGYGFSGDYLTLFGNKEQLEKLAIVVSGPKRNYLATRRQKLYNLWIKKDIEILENIMSFHGAWASNDIKENFELLDFYDIVHNYGKDEQFNGLKELEDYMEFKKLYRSLETINPSNNTLFKVVIPLPNNATIGRYLVNIMSFDDTMNVSSKTVASFEIKHSDFNQFLFIMNKEYHKTYLIMLYIVSFMTSLLVRYFFIKKV